jgi:hypothetical protein
MILDALPSTQRFSIHSEVSHMSHVKQEDADRPLRVAGSENGSASAPISVIRDGRIVLDPERFIASAGEDQIDPSDPLASEWTRMCQTITVFPFPGGERGPMAEALLRDEVEYSASRISAESGCRWIVDKRLEGLFEMAIPLSQADAVGISTGIRAPLGVTATESLPKMILRRLVGQRAPSASDLVKIGPGVLSSSTGGTRVNSECVTSVFHEAGSNDRIDLRIISEQRTIRLRFDSRNDPRFLAFWPRWRAEPRSDSVSASSA